MKAPTAPWRTLSASPKRRLGAAGALALALVALFATGSCARAYVQAPVGGAPLETAEPVSVFYLIGDFGKPAEPFRDLTAALAQDVRDLGDVDLRTAPMILELGDNLYEDGLPHDLEVPGASREVEKLRAVAEGFEQVRYGDAQVPLALIPGNHDYGNDALDSGGNLGDISRWYFLADLAIAGADAWVQVPGDAARFADAGELRAHIAGDPQAHAEFMAAMVVPHLDRDVHIVAIDSELVLDLYDNGYDEIAARYWQALEQQLAAAPGTAWRFIATHHPPVTYGKHGAPSFGNWVFGQGWPQFPKTWQKALAVAMPLGIVAGVLVHPAAVALSAGPPVSTALATRRKQDVGSRVYDRYAAELLRIAAARGVDGIFAGHDHNSQFIELSETGGFGGEALLVISGAGSKVDPVRRGPGTVAYLSDYSFVRVTQYTNGLSFEILDRDGRSRYRHQLAR